MSGLVRAITADTHPAPFSVEIITALRKLLPSWVPTSVPIHDPFAGEGVRLGLLCDQLGYTFSGTDLEAWEGADRRVVLGDATNVETYPLSPFVVVTSPTYNNGVNDHFEPRDDSRRLTYRVAAGHELLPNNTGRYSGRGSKKAEDAYWRITRQAVAHWPELAFVNVKDSFRGPKRYPLVELMTRLLVEHEYDVTQIDVRCKGWKLGENRAEPGRQPARVDTEAVLIARRGDRAPWSTL